MRFPPLNSASRLRGPTQFTPIYRHANLCHGPPETQGRQSRSSYGLLITRLISCRDLPIRHHALRSTNHTGGGSWLAFAALWLDIANRRSNLPSRLPEAIKQIDMTKWPAPLIRLYLGQLTPEAVLAAADDPDATKKKNQVCGANFYSGELALQRGAKDEATRLSQLAVTGCSKSFTDDDVANAELKALGVSPRRTEQEAIGASPQPQRTEQEALGASPPRTEPEVQAPASSRVKLLGLELTELTSKLRSQYKIRASRVAGRGIFLQISAGRSGLRPIIEAMRDVLILRKMAGEEAARAAPYVHPRRLRG